jgi:hypothetical protein
MTQSPPGVARAVFKAVGRFAMDMCFALAPVFFPIPSELLAQRYGYRSPPGDLPSACEESVDDHLAGAFSPAPLSPAEQQKWEMLVRQLR